MKIYFNQQPLTLESTIILADFLEQQGYKQQAFAIAINQQFVPKSQYKIVTVQDGDRIQLVAPMQGG